MGAAGVQSGGRGMRARDADAAAEAGGPDEGTVARVLLIGVDEALEEDFARWGERQDVPCVSSPEGAPPSRRFALAVVGSLRGASAGTRFRSLRKTLAGCPLVALVEDVPVETVVQIVRAGAADVIGLPAPSADVVARAVLHLDTQKGGSDPDALASHAPAFRHVADEIRAVAPMRSTVLLTGETGTGKGLLARTIHELSDRADRPFVHVDCAALSATVIESELFGHQRGAFTGAVESRPGRFELAGDGTIFLDEIGELDPALQVKLLRILEDREFERIGATRTQVMNARVIAATSRDLRQAVEDGTFRADLFFRLEVFHVRVPPLRERAEDLTLLVRRGLEALAARLDLPVPGVTDAFCQRLREHPWPGNVRQLMNVLERAMVRMGAGVLDAEALDALLPAPGPEHVPRRAAAPPPVASGDSERDAVESVLRAVGGNVSRAARRLGVPRTTLRYRVRQLGLEHLLPRD